MTEITIVGLGPGSPSQISTGALAALRNAKHLYLRTMTHPVVPWLVAELNLASTDFTAFDSYYETADSFEEVYQQIFQTLTTELYAGKEIVYAVPGHPRVAETTVTQLVDWARQEQKTVSIVPSMSCLDAVYTALSIDPTIGLVIADALDLPEVLPGKPMLVTQVYNRLVASDVKLQLMEHLADEHPITVVRGAGMPGEERIVKIPLYRLDNLPWIDHLTSVYVEIDDQSLVDTIPEQAGCAYPLDPLVGVMQRLRAPDGCPWDYAQTNESLRRYLVEETYEVLEAIDEQEWDKVEEELGDVLLQVVFHAAIAAEHQWFDINDVIATVTQKLIRRHPHIFGDVEVKNAQEVTVNWEKIKQQERRELGQEYKSVLDGVPMGLPALTQAEKIQVKAARVGFEWADISGAIAKVKEELQELAEAQEHLDHANIQAEMGDVFFALVNVARYLGIDPEMALRATTRKFISRFHYIEETADQQGLELTTMDLDKMDQLWDAAKAKE